MNKITLSQLVKIFPNTKQAVLELYVEPLNKTFEKYDISTVARQAAFIAQVGHESGGFSTVKENLNYSQQGLLATFPKYFPTAALAGQYARNPEKIANRVYANRMGNGPETSGDGWKFRGRGGIQVTGSSNYNAFATALGMTLDKAIAYLETPEGAIISAGWFWDKTGLNALADQTRFTDMTKRINGGVNGIDHRKELWNKAKVVLG